MKKTLPLRLICTILLLFTAYLFALCFSSDFGDKSILPTYQYSAISCAILPLSQTTASVTLYDKEHFSSATAYQPTADYETTAPSPISKKRATLTCFPYLTANATVTLYDKEHFSSATAYALTKQADSKVNLPQTYVNAERPVTHLNTWQSATHLSTEQGTVTVGSSENPPFVRVRDKNVYFYSAPNEKTILFAITPTYYLRVLGREGNYFRVEIMEESRYFCKIIGYVDANCVEEITTAPANPLYPQEVLSVTSSSARLYVQPSADVASLITATNAQQMGYYGKVIAGGTVWYYVCYGEYLGYVNGNYLSMPNITAHPTPLSTQTVEVVVEPEIEPPTVVDEPTPSPILEQPTLLALVLLIIIPTAVIIGLLFVPERKKKVKHTEYIDLTTGSTNNGKPRYYDDYV